MPKINLETDNVVPSNLLPVAKQVAQQFMTRSENQGLKGKKRDEMALEFVLGCRVWYAGNGRSIQDEYASHAWVNGRSQRL